MCVCALQIFFLYIKIRGNPVTEIEKVQQIQYLQLFRRFPSFGNEAIKTVTLVTKGALWAKLRTV